MQNDIQVCQQALAASGEQYITISSVACNYCGMDLDLIPTVIVAIRLCAKLGVSPQQTGLT